MYVRFIIVPYMYFEIILSDFDSFIIDNFLFFDIWHVLYDLYNFLEILLKNGKLCTSFNRKSGQSRVIMLVSGEMLRLSPKLAVLLVMVAAILPAIHAWGKSPPPPLPELSFLEKGLKFLTDTLVGAETWMLPYGTYQPLHVSLLDTVLALDTCSAYRQAMHKDRHPWLQVFFRADPCPKFLFSLDWNSENSVCRDSIIHLQSFPD